MTISVLMYHALYLNDQEYSQIPDEDRPYAISVTEFQQQLNLLVENNVNVIDPVKLNGEQIIINDTVKHAVLLTFDDGHASFFTYAYPELLKRNMSAIFFITSDLIHERTDFCNWEQLKEMSANGMSIQSHGKTHKFISDLGEKEAFGELKESKKIIESQLNSSVRCISFPGGRYSNRDIKSGLSMGYEYFFTSKEGVNNNEDFTKERVIKRIALRNSTNKKEFLSLSKGEFFIIKKRILMYLVKHFIKKIIGNSIYHVLYKRHRIS